MTKSLSYDDYLRLAGLLALAADHRRMLEAIDRAACAITGDEPAAGSHTSDAVWSGDRSLADVLMLLGITTPKPPPATTTPEDASRQAASAMRIVQRARERSGEESS
jgi:hypothetical protein